MAKLSKKQKSLAEKLDANKLYTVDEAIKTIKELSTAKFDETIEIAMNLGVDPRHADQMVRGMVSLPSGTGKDVKVAVFARGDNAEKATAAGADKVGAEDLMEDMQAGNLDYDRVIATPDMMALSAVSVSCWGPRVLCRTRNWARLLPMSSRPSRTPRADRSNSALRSRASSIPVWAR